jgi:hypothetical protein
MAGSRRARVMLAGSRVNRRARACTSYVMPMMRF